MLWVPASTVQYLTKEPADLESYTVKSVAGERAEPVSIAPCYHKLHPNAATHHYMRSDDNFLFCQLFNYVRYSGVARNSQFFWTNFVNLSFLFRLLL